jgi:arylsulfatase A-like enzyme
MIAVISACGGAGAPSAMFLVSLDTLRADRLGAYGNDRGLTPNLDHFAAESVVFTHAYAQATLTAPSHASLFTSRYPPELRGAGRAPSIPAGAVTLAEAMQVGGWTTGAFVCGGDLSSTMGLDRGFGTYRSGPDFGSLWHTAPMATAWLDAHEHEPVLLFLHGYDAHSRYLKPTPFGYGWGDATATGPGQDAVRGSTELIVDHRLLPDEGPLALVDRLELRPRSEAGRAALAEATPPTAPTLDPADEARVRDAYDGAVAWADAMFGLWMADLASRGWLERATIVVLADHGEQLGEDGMFNHCCGAGDAETHVPLMVRLPAGEGGGRRVDGVVELVDVMPTVLELARVDAAPGMRGVSLGPTLRGDGPGGKSAAFSVGGDGARLVSARTPGGRLTAASLPAHQALLPDLLEAAAPDGPTFARVGEAPEPGVLVAWLRSLSLQEPAAAQPADRTLQEELRRHGYWSEEP